jgi:hypothetical protein
MRRVPRGKKVKKGGGVNMDQKAVNDLLERPSRHSFSELTALERDLRAQVALEAENTALRADKAILDRAYAAVVFERDSLRARVERLEGAILRAIPGTPANGTADGILRAALDESSAQVAEGAIAAPGEVKL